METFWIIRFHGNDEPPSVEKFSLTERSAIQRAEDYSLVRGHDAILVIAPERQYQVIHKIV